MEGWNHWANVWVGAGVFTATPKCFNAKNTGYSATKRNTELIHAVM